jgi:hypothetical protein
VNLGNGRKARATGQYGACFTRCSVASATIFGFAGLDLIAGLGFLTWHHDNRASWYCLKRSPIDVEVCHHQFRARTKVLEKRSH